MWLAGVRHHRLAVVNVGSMIISYIMILKWYFKLKVQ